MKSFILPQFQKTILTLFISSALLLLFLPTSVMAKSKMPSGTEIAHILVEGKTEEEIKQILENEIDIWHAEDALVLKSEFENIEMPRTAFEFNIDATIASLQDKTKRSLSSFFLKPKDVQLPLIATIDKEDENIRALMNRKDIDTDVVFNQLIEAAGILSREDLTLAYKNEDLIPLETIEETKVSFNNLSSSTIQEVVDQLDGYIIKPGTPFSFLKSFNIYETLKNDTANTALASGLYTLFLHTNYDMIERHIARYEPEEVEKGNEAYINLEEEKDFIIHNPNDVAFVIKAKKLDKTILLQLQSTFDVSSHDYEIEEEKVAYRTIYRYSNQIPAGEERLIQTGQPGSDVKTYRYTYDNTGLLLDTTLVSHDTYMPVPEIVLRSIKTPEEGAPEDNNQEDESNDLVHKDEWKEIETSIEELEIELDMIETREVNMDEHVSSAINQINDQANELKNNYQSLSEHLNEIHEQVEKNSEASTEETDKLVNKWKKENEALKKEIDTLHEDMQTLEKQLDKISEHLDAS